MAVVVLGALLAPPLYWAGQSLAAQGVLPFLAAFDFERFFHRSLLIAGLILLWPLFRSIQVRKLADLALVPNPRSKRDLLAGFLLAAIPLLCGGAILVALHVYTPRWTLTGSALAKLLGSVAVVPLIEEGFFRGLLLGILLRSGRKYLAMFITSAVYSIVHFLKAPEQTSPVVTWLSGFNSIAHSFHQFGDATLLLAAFTTLFVVGWILADARLRTNSLWLSIGLHAGWIFGNGIFNRFVRRRALVLGLPWMGKNLLVGLIPLSICVLTWLLIWTWLKRDVTRKVENPSNK